MTIRGAIDSPRKMISPVDVPSMGDPYSEYTSIADASSDNQEFIMNPIVSAALVAALTLTSALSAHAGNDRADVIMNRTLHGYQQLSQHGQWINHWMPAATGNQPRTEASADQKMVAIIASYTREALDRGGWVNTVLTNSEYASGNPLVGVRVGEGLTWRVALDVVTGLTTVTAWNTPNLDAFDQSKEQLP